MLEHVFVIAFCAPVANQALVGEERIVCGEEDAVLEAPRNLVLEIGRMVFRRPAVELVPDLSLVKKNRDGLGLPGPARAAGDDVQAGEARGHIVEMAWMALVEHHSAARRKSGAKTRGADEDQ